MKPNYAYEKRQRELEKKRRKEDKAQRKALAMPPLRSGQPAPDSSTPPPGTPDAGASA